MTRHKSREGIKHEKQVQRRGLSSTSREASRGAEEERRSGGHSAQRAHHTPGGEGQDGCALMRCGGATGWDAARRGRRGAPREGVRPDPLCAQRSLCGSTRSSPWLCLRSPSAGANSLRLRAGGAQLLGFVTRAPGDSNVEPALRTSDRRKWEGRETSHHLPRQQGRRRGSRKSWVL